MSSWDPTKFIENRGFDTRLVLSKQNLLAPKLVRGGPEPSNRDYRQFLESIYNNPWSTSGALPCLEQVSGPSIPARVGTAYQTTRPHPWRPKMGFETIEVNPLPEAPITNSMVNPCFSPAGMSTEPMSFPNLVTGFERNPQHAARAALYTRYTIGEWMNNNLTRYSESDTNRNQSERVRNEAVRVMRETDEKTFQGQREAGRRIGERITDVTFWRNELNSEREKLAAEITALTETKRNVEKAIQDLEPPIHIAQECLYHREARKGMEKVHDHCEKSILLEIDNLRTSQSRIKALHDKVCAQFRDIRAAQQAIEEDINQKEGSLGIDSVCHQLNNYSRGLNYYGGVEKFDPSVSTIESWTQSTSKVISRSQSERGKTVQLRSDISSAINQIAATVWEYWNNTNNSLERRCSEMLETKNKVQLHLLKVTQELFNLEKHISLLSKAVQDKSFPLKVAQTRLEARTHREGVELCKDSAMMRLVQEVQDIQDSVQNLHYKLQESEAQHQMLIKTRSNLEADLNKKVNALYIDREKCLGLRRSFPVNTLIKY